ncbi:RteC domain-containing protein [Mucilaginibacter calamicampi]|uniref:RteC domain-containing protein n=1 Tax=Mucilaginibacter calamicampi TaxID=1302352 RepID=A0ABW2YSD9_9SPHI
MKTFTERFGTALENQLAEVSEPTLGNYRASVLICKKAMTKLKNYVSSYAFENTEEEINFFKHIKPRFYSKYIYFINVYNFLVQRPVGSETIQQDYINMHLDEVKTFFDHNRLFYAYYRSGMTQLDDLYYTRGGFDVHAELEDFEEDEQYSTSHDYKLSKIMANEQFQEYLNRELTRLNADPAALIQPFKHPAWTATQTDAIELIYALKSAGAVNNGNIDIAELVTIFEHIFQFELKEYYHKFTDITRRKKDVPVFLNKLKDGLIRWIDDKMGL